MQKVIENAVLKITQAMEKNRKAYEDAQQSYGDTGYDRYWNKMKKLDAEYEELKDFIQPKERDELYLRFCVENAEIEKLLHDIKGHWHYVKADLPVSADTIVMDDLMRDIK